MKLKFCRRALGLVQSFNPCRHAIYYFFTNSFNNAWTSLSRQQMFNKALINCVLLLKVIAHNFAVSRGFFRLARSSMNSSDLDVNLKRPHLPFLFVWTFPFALYRLIISHTVLNGIFKRRLTSLPDKAATW